MSTHEMPRSNHQFMGTKGRVSFASRKKENLPLTKKDLSTVRKDVFYVREFCQKKKFKKDRTHLLLSNELKIYYWSEVLQDLILYKLHKDNVIEVDH